MTTTLPTDSAERKDIPLQTGCIDYFTAALAYVAQISKAGNDKHNPGQPLHWARGKSSDHADCIQRHQSERGTIDDDGFLHEGKVAWRALAQLQEALEARGAPLSRGSRLPQAPSSNLMMTCDEVYQRIATDMAAQANADALDTEILAHIPPGPLLEIIFPQPEDIKNGPGSISPIAQASSFMEQFDRPRAVPAFMLPPPEDGDGVIGAIR
jgi:hypothetical protein